MCKCRAVAVLFAICAIGCQNKAALLKPIVRATRKPVVRGGVPATRLREEVRNAYRLAPDRRFLLAIGEIDRLGCLVAAPPGDPAEASFEEGRWAIRDRGQLLGTLPELPDIPDYLTMLVQHAKTALHGKVPTPSVASGGLVGEPEPGLGQFLMPGLADEIRRVEGSWKDHPSFSKAARLFARLTFQTPDRLELAPVIPARALALLAAERAENSKAGVEDEILVSYALGYTRHAENLSGGLPAGAPLRLFAGHDDEELWRRASTLGGSEELRYLALRRACSRGNLGDWRNARLTFFPSNSTVAILTLGFGLDLPRQVELENKQESLTESLSRALAREIPAPVPKQGRSPEAGDEIEAEVDAAAEVARGALWDGEIVKGYYEAAVGEAIYFAQKVAGEWPRWSGRSRIGRLLASVSDPKSGGSDQALPHSATQFFIDRAEQRINASGGDYARTVKEVRALAPRLDSRPAHREALASFMVDNLRDVVKAEDLYRSLRGCIGDDDPQALGRIAVFLEDWDGAETLIRSRQVTETEALAILWDWDNSGLEPGRLEGLYAMTSDRFPRDWDVTYDYVHFLRKDKKYGEACEVLRRWLERNRNRNTPGYFHAHITLAYTYERNGEFEKGLELLSGMSESEEFQKAIIKREMAQCLAGLGRLKEADRMAREVVRYTGTESEALRDLVKVLWREGLDKEAAERLGGPSNAMQPWEQCECLKEDLPNVFGRLPAERVAGAVSEIVKQPTLSRWYRCAGDGFAKDGQWERAFQIVSAFPAGNPDWRMDNLVVRYEYLKAWKGPEEAAAWLRGQIPERDRNPLSMKALYTKNDDLLWRVIGTPDPGNHPEWVWLARTTAEVLRGSDGNQYRPILLSHYQTKTGESTNTVARYLLGIGTETEMYADIMTPEGGAEDTFYLAIRAEHEGRLRDANEWYRVAAETPDGTSEKVLAVWALGDWSKRKGEIFRAMKER